jgi:hypothetical protein
VLAIYIRYELKTHRSLGGVRQYKSLAPARAGNTEGHVVSARAWEDI